MPSALTVRIVLGLAAAIYLFLGYIVGVPIEKKWLQLLGGVTMAVVAILTFFDLYLWRWVPQRLTKMPVIDGTWSAELESLWPDAETGDRSRHSCYLVIRQTFSRVRVCTLHRHSRSNSETAAITNTNDECKLSYIYWSSADTLARENNQPHRGAATLVIGRQPRVTLRGDYWTERDHGRGTLTAIGYSKHHFDTFADADAADYEPLR